jgi:hypothetical protein
MHDTAGLLLLWGQRRDRQHPRIAIAQPANALARKVDHVGIRRGGSQIAFVQDDVSGGERITVRQFERKRKLVVAARAQPEHHAFHLGSAETARAAGEPKLSILRCQRDQHAAQHLGAFRGAGDEHVFAGGRIGPRFLEERAGFRVATGQVDRPQPVPWDFPIDRLLSAHTHARRVTRDQGTGQPTSVREVEGSLSRVGRGIESVVEGQRGELVPTQRAGRFAVLQFHRAGIEPAQCAAVFGAFDGGRDDRCRVDRRRRDQGERERNGKSSRSHHGCSARDW